MDNIIMALQSLKSNKMRALLTMLGIIIGIGAVIAIETMGNSLSGSISDSMSGFGVSDISVSLTQKESDDETSQSTPIKMFMSSTPGEKDRITDQMIEEYKSAFPNNVAFVELTESVGTASYKNNDTSYNLTVTGINDDYVDAEDIQIIYGRKINNETDAQRKLCVVADKFVTESMGIQATNAIGREITISLSGTNYTFYIVGVYRYDDSNSLSMTNSETTVVTECYIPLQTAKSITKAKDGYSSLTVVTTADTNTSTFLTTTEEYFSSYYTTNDTWTVEASSMESLVSTVTSMLDSVSLAISAIAAISLLVGGIGVMNIMLVSVTERTKEIGTRKALGARRSTIRMQFIIESVVICFIGGILGVLTGTGLGAIACNILGYSAKADMPTIITVVLISMAIGIFFGYYPANKAAKLNPIDALRYE